MAMVGADVAELEVIKEPLKNTPIVAVDAMAVAKPTYSSREHLGVSFIATTRSLVCFLDVHVDEAGRVMAAVLVASTTPVQDPSCSSKEPSTAAQVGVQAVLAANGIADIT